MGARRRPLRTLRGPMLDDHFGPEVAARCVTFTADTFDLVLKERVAVILRDVLGDEWRQHVAPA